jgi:hypothetical protein
MSTSQGLDPFRLLRTPRLNAGVFDDEDCPACSLCSDGPIEVNAQQTTRGIGRFEIDRSTIHAHSSVGYGEVAHPFMPNDPSSATRPAARHDCNSEAMAGFAAAHGSAIPVALELGDKRGQSTLPVAMTRGPSWTANSLPG